MQTGLLHADTSCSSLPVQGGCDSTDRTATFREVRLIKKQIRLNPALAFKTASSRLPALHLNVNFQA